MIANRHAIVLVAMVLALLAGACSESGQEPTSASAYFVGNSLTNETLGPIVDGRRSLATMTEQVDFDTDPLGWHIRCGSSLIGIAMNPDDTCVDPHVEGATYPDALDDEDWDIAVFQPYPGPGSTLGTDIEVISPM